MKFSQRIGIAPVETRLQVQDITPALRNSLWNVLDMHIWGKEEFLHHRIGGLGEIGAFSRELWLNFFKLPLDKRSKLAHDILSTIREYYFNSKWYEVYEFLEFVVNYYNKNRELVKALNTVLERELAGYRCIKWIFVHITDELEIEAIEKALTEGPFSGVHAHLRQAMQHLSRRDTPDYRNSIKESISAVESMARELIGNKSATLADALSELEKKSKLHPALKRGFAAIYGYTSDEGGIRHGMLDEPNLGPSDAKYFLISCATFINYLKAKIDGVT